MKIYILSEGTTAIVPVVPNNVYIGRPKETLEKDTVRGKVFNKGKIGSLQIQWNSFFPVNKNYKFVNVDSWPDGMKYVTFIEDIRKNDKECRCCVLTDEGYGLANFLCDISEFSYSVDKVGDVLYSITLSELKVL